MNSIQSSPLNFGINYSHTGRELKTLETTIKNIVAKDPEISKRISEIEAKGIGIDIHTTSTTPAPSVNNKYYMYNIQTNIGWDKLPHSTIEVPYNPEMKRRTRKNFARRLLNDIIAKGEEMASRLKILKPKDAPAPKPVKAKQAQKSSLPATVYRSQDNKPTAQVSEEPDRLKLKIFEENVRRELNEWRFKKDEEAGGLFDELQDLF